LLRYSVDCEPGVPAIFFLLFVLVLCIFLVHLMLSAKFHYIPESLAIGKISMSLPCSTTILKIDFWIGRYLPHITYFSIKNPLQKCLFSETKTKQQFL
jgi:hypothetical protein